MLNDNENETPDYGESEIPIDGDSKDIPLTACDEVQVAVAHLNNIKVARADILLTNFFKHDGNERIRCMYQLMHRMWSEEGV